MLYRNCRVMLKTFGRMQRAALALPGEGVP